MITPARILRRYGLEPGIILLSLLICTLFFSVVHDDYGSFFLNMVSGQYSDFAFFDIFWLGMFGVNTIYKFMHQHFPAYNWMAMSFLALTLTSLYLLLKTVRYFLEKYHLGLSVIICVELIFAMLFLQNIIIISHTRFSLLFCGISAFNFAFRNDLSKKEFCLYAIIFVLGLLHRPESAPGMLAVVTIGYFVHSRNLGEYLRRIWFPVLFTASILGYIGFDRMTSTDFVKRIEPEIEYKLMGRRIVSLSDMKTAADSVKYQAGITGMWFDFKVTNPEFLRTLLLPGLDTSKRHASEVLHHIVSYYYFFSVIGASYLFLMGVILLYADRKMALSKIIIFHMGVFVLIICLDYTGFLVDHRHFLNIQLIALLISLSFFAGAGFSRFPNLLSRTGSWVLLAGLLIIMYQTIDHLKSQNTSMVADTDLMEATMQDIEKTYQNRTIVLTMGNGNLTNHRFSIFNKNYTRNRYILYEMFSYSLMPKYLTYQERICHCDATDPEAYFSWLSDIRGLYIGDPDRFELTSRYMRLVHGFNLEFSTDSSFARPPYLHSHEYKNLEIRRVSTPDRGLRK